MKPKQASMLALGWPCRCGAEVTREGALCADCVRREVAAGRNREAIDHALWLELGEVAFDCLYAEGEDPEAWTIEAAFNTAAERERQAWSASYLRAWSRRGTDSMDNRARVGYWPIWPQIPLTRWVETWWPDDWPDVPEPDPGVYAVVEADEHCWVVWYPARPVVDAPVGAHL